MIPFMVKIHSKLFFLTGITPYKAIQPLICMELHKKKVKNRNNIYIYIYNKNPKEAKGASKTKTLGAC